MRRLGRRYGEEDLGMRGFSVAGGRWTVHYVRILYFWLYFWALGLIGISTASLCGLAYPSAFAWVCFEAGGSFLIRVGLKLLRFSARF